MGAKNLTIHEDILKAVKIGSAETGVSEAQLINATLADYIETTIDRVLDEQGKVRQYPRTMPISPNEGLAPQPLGIQLTQVGAKRRDPSGKTPAQLRREEKEADARAQTDANVAHFKAGERKCARRSIEACIRHFPDWDTPDGHYDKLESPWFPPHPGRLEYLGWTAGMKIPLLVLLEGFNNATVYEQFFYDVFKQEPELAAKFWFNVPFEMVFGPGGHYMQVVDYENPSTDHPLGRLVDVRREEPLPVVNGKQKYLFVNNQTSGLDPLPYVPLSPTHSVSVPIYKDTAVSTQAS